MSNIIVITFENMEEADKVLKTIRSVQHEGYINLDDSAVVVRDEEGEFQVKNEVDRGVKIGALGGGAIGLLIGGLLFPVAGILVGVLGGAAVGALAGVGIDKKFVKEVEGAMEPGTSAIVLIVRESNPDVAIAALKPYKGTVYSTTLSPEDEAEVRRILSKRI
jgi:uncharacterized membrane protein